MSLFVDFQLVRTVAFVYSICSGNFPSVDARGKLGGIACPPELLATIPIDKGPGLHLFHYDRDLLCCWQPSWDSPSFQ